MKIESETNRNNLRVVIEKVNNRFDKKIEEHAAKASRVEKRLEKEKLDEQNDNINKQNVDLKDKCTGTNDSPILLPVDSNISKYEHTPIDQESEMKTSDK
ncbi:hypothetical protein, partial [Klebsiella pneumoniae]|uniref:hypothetical protein n=2 Tax=Klebsiella pneumoniae TaxID=573 RepID=UPI0040556B59